MAGAAATKRANERWGTGAGHAAEAVGCGGGASGWGVGDGVSGMGCRGGE